MALVEHAPRFSEDDAIAFAQEHYGLQATARSIPSERDQNFRLATDSGDQSVLKIANATESREILDFQNQIMQRLTEKMPGNSCFQQVIPTQSGEHITTVHDTDGTSYFLRLVTYLPGIPLAEYSPHTPDMLHALGQVLGVMEDHLAGFSHPAADRELHWDLKHAGKVIDQHIDTITDPDKRAIVEHFRQLLKTVEPKLPELRQSIIHGDANDYNVLVESRGLGSWALHLVDFGDAVHTYTVNEIAIAAAYVMLDKPDPLAVAWYLVAGYYYEKYHHPYIDQELEILFPLICARLCLTVCLATHQRTLNPENDYLSISEKPAWDLLEKLKDVHPRFAYCLFQSACGLYPHHKRVVEWLKDNQATIGPVVDADLQNDGLLVFDLSVGSALTGEITQATYAAEDKTAQFSKILFERMKAAGVEVGIGRYNEARVLYDGEQFATGTALDRRTIHTGMDVFMQAGSPIFAPLDGVVHSFQNNALPYDYGPTIILEHTVEDNPTFYTLYGHLSADSLQGLSEGQVVEKGEKIGTIGDFPENGSWPPHLHFQIITDMLDKRGDFPGVCAPSHRKVWLSLSPDPNLILRIPQKHFPPAELNKSQILHRRKQHIGPSLSISYKEPLKIVRGFMQYLYDDEGRVYLDAVNNVPHVGHCHPHVVRAAQQQTAVLNTNTRYLHPYLVEYAERLCATLPDPLSVCFFVNSGSEANDLALRLARAHTGGSDIIVLDSAYHGNLSTLIEISPYKFDGPGGQGAPVHVQKVPTPDVYRGRYKADDPEAGMKYGSYVGEAIANIHAEGEKLAAFYVESLPGCGGQIVLPENYLNEAFRHVRAAGGVCIADEVQVGFGRVGSHFWGFQTQGVVPDIVTLGKPIGNGHPLAAVITTPEIAQSFNNGMEYFNTFGGNPVSCAVGMAVLDVIENERLQENALITGNHLLAGLEQLKAKHRLIGDVRGLGLYVGVELVLDRDTLEPAGEHASYIANRMKDCGILISTDGPLHNVLKIKPPLVFDKGNADFLVSTLDDILGETALCLG